MLKFFRKNESGATAVEYGLIIALVGTVAAGSLKLMGTGVSQKLNEVKNTILLDPTDRPKTAAAGATGVSYDPTTARTQ